MFCLYIPLDLASSLEIKQISSTSTEVHVSRSELQALRQMTQYALGSVILISPFKNAGPEVEYKKDGVRQDHGHSEISTD